MTYKDGNAFRNDVAALLRAAGFIEVEIEKRVGFKHVDIATVWSRNSLDGNIRYVIETKDYSKTLPLADCSLFCAQYGDLVRAGIVDRAWLISRGEISPAGRNQIKSAHGSNLDCMTFEELQAKVFNLDGYLLSIANEYLLSGIANYYVAPRLKDDNDLQVEVLRWLGDPRSTPLAILGSYGQGKSTFALHLANYLIEQRKQRKTSRIPILIPLGDIFDEQSIDGLLGKLFASKHRVDNYHFSLFSALNEQGWFVVIFDGFDEMKHGMTFSALQNNITEIMKLDRGKAKIIILGRTTAFHDDREFRAVIQGRDFTIIGQDIASTVRRSCIQLEMRDFSREESIKFVNNYLRYRISNSDIEHSQASANWAKWRIDQICDPIHDSIRVRPVHAQMMCDVALDPEFQFTAMTMYDLYDAFVHQLLAREVRKRGRFQAIGVDQRRKFNRGIAWWLWKQGGISSSSLADLPNEICAAAAVGVLHPFDQEGLKRELVAGCLVEKGGGGVYFGHRSIQEFLVAEYIWDELLYMKNAGSEIELEKRVTPAELALACTYDIMQFIDGRIRFELRKGRGVLMKIAAIISASAALIKGAKVSRDLIYPYFRIAASAGTDDYRIYRHSPIGLAIAFFAANDAISYEVKNVRSIDFLRRVIREGFNELPERVLNIVYLWIQVAIHNIEMFDDEMVAEFVVRLLPLERIAPEVTLLLADPIRLARVSEDTSLRHWLFSNFMRRTAIGNMEKFVIFWSPLISYLHLRDSRLLQQIEFSTEHDLGAINIECSLEMMIKQLSTYKLDDFSKKNIELFFGSTDIRSRFVPRGPDTFLD